MKTNQKGLQLPKKLALQKKTVLRLKNNTFWGDVPTTDVPTHPPGSSKPYCLGM
jgi:hypothetical protein